MKKEYSVLVKFRKSETKWHNATSIVLGLNRRHVNTYEEAKDVLETALERFNGKPKVERQDCNGIGIDIVIDERSAKVMEIIDYKIKVREVSEWETIV